MSDIDNIELIEAKDLMIGRYIKFPNSRGFQEVEQIVANAGSITLHAGDAQWVVKPEFVVHAQREPEGQADEETTDDD
jgi:hypothetical protein